MSGSSISHEIPAETWTLITDLTHGVPSPEDVCPDLGCDFAAEATVNLEEWPGPDWQGMVVSGGNDVIMDIMETYSLFYDIKLSGHSGKDG